MSGLAYLWRFHVCFIAASVIKHTKHSSSSGLVRFIATAVVHSSINHKMAIVPFLQPTAIS